MPSVESRAMSVETRVQVGRHEPARRTYDPSTEAVSSVVRASRSRLVSIVIPNDNGRHLLAGCLESIRCQTYPLREVIVVDNGSTDGSVEWLRREFPEVRLIALPTNRGFAGG